MSFGTPVGGWPATSLRVRSSQETWQLGRRLMPRLGITRVTAVTQLDRLGVPVHVSVRPRGRTLRVHAGKGLSDDDARTGALMEALEFAVAERASAQQPLHPMSLRDIVAQWPAGVGPMDLAPVHGVAIDPERVCSAVECEWLGVGEPVWLPAELVHLPWTTDGEPYLYGWTTNGLASGNTLEEATLHALLEVLERDAVALNRGRDSSARLIDATLPPPWRDWAGQWAGDGVELIVRQTPSAVGLACFEAHLHDHSSLDVNLTSGAGLHLDRGIALARAISEAAQSRLSVIHGGRDDIARFFAKYRNTDPDTRQKSEAQLLAQLRDESRTIAFDDVPHSAMRSPARALKVLLRRMGDAGFAHVFRRKLSPAGVGLEASGLHVVKIVVPGCEALDGENKRIGRRLQARVLGFA